MSRPQTVEQRRLAQAEQVLAAAAHTHTGRLQLLEAAAAAKSGGNVREYWERFGCPPAAIDPEVLSRLVGAIEGAAVPFPMAVSSLAREPLSVGDQKKNGVFYTDFRLAQLMAADCREKLREGTSAADFAAGTGILLAGIAAIYQQKYPGSFNEWVAHHLYAFDLSPAALRGARAALLSMTSDLPSLQSMDANWRAVDSLLDPGIEALPVDLIVGNPPWGKIKLSRHGFLAQNGGQQVYGTPCDGLDSALFEEQKAALRLYSKAIREKFDLLGHAEPDMYMAFLQRAIERVAEGGHISYLVPAGLIRSQGTQGLRRYLLRQGSRVEFVLLDNQANYFSIDTRFKFVMLSFEKAGQPGGGLDRFYFSTAGAGPSAVSKTEGICFPIPQLEPARPDLTIPEVRSGQEKALFFKIWGNGRPWGTTDDIWRADIAREVDMTNNRGDFTNTAGPDSLPVVEGRMVQQHRFGAKTYLSGQGRSAKWAPCSAGGRPQFYYPRGKLPPLLAGRASTVRAGFCDIAGQTNERGMMSAAIPANVVCGNKVPTICFPNDPSGDLLYLWIGITNSFVFDWMIRRVISTTINYFLLFSIPMPAIAPDSGAAQEIIQKAKQLSAMGSSFYTSPAMAGLRSDIDVLVAEAYGLTTGDLKRILEDFPILDRRQPCIAGEKKSTITRDLVLSKCEQHLDKLPGYYTQRYQQAVAQHARAYLPTEMTGLSQNEGA